MEVFLVDKINNKVLFSLVSNVFINVQIIISRILFILLLEFYYILKRSCNSLNVLNYIIIAD